MPRARPTASTITDDQLDALWDALDELELVHEPLRMNGRPTGWCACGEVYPCTTIEIISRQRSIALEPICPKDGPDQSDG